MPRFILILLLGLIATKGVAQKKDPCKKLRSEILIWEDFKAQNEEVWKALQLCLGNKKDVEVMHQWVITKEMFKRNHFEPIEFKVGDLLDSLEAFKHTNEYADILHYDHLMDSVANLQATKENYQALFTYLKEEFHRSKAPEGGDIIGLYLEVYYEKNKEPLTFQELFDGFHRSQNYNDEYFQEAVRRLGVYRKERKEAKRLTRLIKQYEGYTYEEGIAMGRKLNRPVFLHFNGWSCTNCRLMEEYVLIQDSILDVIEHEVVFINLYVDDKTPIEEPYMIKTTSRRVKVETIGQMNAELELTMFDQITQPLFAVIDSHTGAILDSIGYTPDEKQFQSWLNQGVEKFAKTYPAEKEELEEKK